MSRSDRRSGRAAVWREALAFARRHVLGVAVLAVALAAVDVVAFRRLEPVAPVAAGVVVGVSATAFCWSVVWLLWVSSGLAQRLQGTLADDWTGEALHRLRLRGNWHLVPAVHTGGERVDHVLVCPAGVVAVEAKWSVQPWVADDVSRAAERAAVAASGVERLVRTVRADLPVRAAIVVWGPASRALVRRQVPMGRHLVDLVPAHEVKAWSRGLRLGPVEPAVSAEVAAAVEAYAAQRAEPVARPSAGPVLRWLARPR